MKNKIGRPKILNYSKRTIIQVNDEQLDAIAKIRGKMSISHFFRVAAKHLIDNPHLLRNISHEQSN